jgi:hypothetical protein
MNPNFRFRFLKKTVLACIQAIGPRDLNIKGLDHHVLQTLEHQLKCFPFWHRVGFLLGLSFLEWGMILGGWGFIPLRFLSPDQAQNRIMILSKSTLHPLRFFIHGLKVLICLAAYTHPKVEEHFGFERRRWRANRIQFHDQLEWSTYPQNHVHLPSYPPTPTALASKEVIDPDQYLAWDAQSLLPVSTPLESVASSPFYIHLHGKIEIKSPKSPKSSIQGDE